MIVPALTDLTQSDKKLDIPEIRVWYHPEKGGNDTYKVFNSFREALDFIKKNDNAERQPLIAFKGYELNLWAMETEKKPKV